MSQSYRSLLVVIAALLWSSTAVAQSPSDAVRDGTPRVPRSSMLRSQPQRFDTSYSARTGDGRPVVAGSIDGNTRWEFRSKPSVTIPSTIIRLRDVVTPLNPSMTGWQRLEGTVVGLIPATSDSVVIDRDRLATVIRKADARPRAIDLIGPTKIKVFYQPGASVPDRLSSARAAPDRAAVDRSAQTGSNRSSLTQTLAPRFSPEILDERRARIAVSMIQNAIKRQLRDVNDAYVFSIDLRSPELTPLASMRGEPRVEFEGEPKEGTCRLSVNGVNLDGPCHSVIPVTLKANPLIVVARTRFPRGHRFRHEDLTTKPISPDEMDEQMISDTRELVGMELRRPLNASRPVMRSDVGAPILIHRGDQLEIRVMGGGIVVATNGKALEDGSERQLINVETSETRKTLLATVIQSGVVEVVSRTQRVEQ